MEPVSPLTPRATTAGLVVELLRPPFWTSGMIFFLGVSGMVLANLIATFTELWVSSATFEALSAPAALIVVGLLLVGIVLGRRIIAYVRPLPPISFFHDHLTLPTTTTAVRAKRVDYTDILTIAVRGEPPRGLLVLESRRFLAVYAFGAFKEADGPQRVIEELNRRISALPQGAEMVAQAEKRQSLGEAAMMRRPWATQALIGILVVIFVNQLLAGSFEQILGNVRWGANAPALVKHGEYFRLMSANFLHGGSLHLLFNLLALWLIGGLLERLVGWARFTSIYLSSGIAAMAASALVGAGSESVGASGAIFGILGGLAVVNWRYRTELPMGFRQPLRWWLMILALNAALPLALPLVTMARIDVAAHVVGFLFGLVVTLGLQVGEKRLRVGTPPSPLTYAMTFGLIGVNALAMGQAVLHAARFDADARVRVSRLLIEDEDMGPDGLNRVGWSLVIDPSTPPEGLAVAHAAVSRAVADMPEEMTFVDTLATVAFRRGDYDGAVSLERRALETSEALQSGSPAGQIMVRLAESTEGSGLAGTSFYASQLARFLRARLAAGGQVLPPGNALPSLSIVPPPDGAGTDALSTLVLMLTEPALEGFSLYVIAEKGDEPLGLIRLSVAENGVARYDIQLPKNASDVLTMKRVELKVALVVRPSVDVLPEGKATLRFWAHDKQVNALP